MSTQSNSRETRGWGEREKPDKKDEVMGGKFVTCFTWNKQTWPPGFRKQEDPPERRRRKKNTGKKKILARPLETSIK